MSREPKYYEKSVFSVDQTHCNGHIVCSNTMNMKFFRSFGHLRFRCFNDVACEQRNRVVNKIRDQARTMRAETLMWHIRMMLEMDNIRIMRRFRGLKEH